MDPQYPPFIVVLAAGLFGALGGWKACYIWYFESGFGRQKEEEPKGEKKIRALIEWRAAIHEAGHAVCAWNHPQIVRINRVTIDEGSTGEGEVRYIRAKIDTDDSLWCDVMVSMGGIAAEVMEFGRFRSGPARNDLEKALATARVLASRSSTQPPWQIQVPTGPRKLDISTTLRSVTPDSPEAWVLNACYDRAKDLVARDRTRLDRVAQHLAEHGPLGPSEIRGIFGWRLPLFGKGWL
jgi:cell division protease FtsH